MCRNSA